MDAQSFGRRGPPSLLSPSRVGSVPLFLALISGVVASGPSRAWASGVDLAVGPLAFELVGPPGPSEPRGVLPTVRGWSEVGDEVRVRASLRVQQGTFRGNVDYEILLSSDRILDGSDAGAAGGRVFLATGLSTPLDVTFRIPAIPAGPLHVLLALNPRDEPAETERANNVAVSDGTLGLRGTNLLIRSFTAPAIAFIGHAATLTVEIANTSTQVGARGFRYGYGLVDRTSAKPFTNFIFLSEPIVLPPATTRTFVDVVPFASLSRGFSRSPSLIAAVDMFSQVPESDEGDNAVQTVIALHDPAPELTGALLGGPLHVGAGEPLEVGRVLENRGVEPARDVELVYALSVAGGAPEQDVEIARVRTSVAAGERSSDVDVFTVPDDVPAGRHRLVLHLDPDERGSEADRSNDRTVGPEVEVWPAPFRFLVPRLPSGRLGVPYRVELGVDGAATPVRFEIARGALPAGVALDASGVLAGLPAAVGRSSFSVRATAIHGRVERAFDLVVEEPTTDLRVATRALPLGRLLRPYATRLVAVGGAPPYTWRLSGEGPRWGLVLAPSGLLEGRPTTSGRLPLAIEVEDDLGRRALGRLDLSVTPEGDPSIEAIELPPGTIGVPYCAPGTPPVQLVARGAAPLTWSARGHLPPGLELDPSGTLCGTPTRPGEFTVRVVLVDAFGATDDALIPLRIEPGEGCRIVTEALPSPLLGEPYGGEEGVRLEAAGCADPVAWAVRESAGALPPGLALAPQGLLQGRPILSGVFPTVVEATDAIGRRAARTLTLEVAPSPRSDPAEAGGGCSAGLGSRGDLGLGVLTLAWAWIALRRRAHPDR